MNTSEIEDVIKQRGGVIVDDKGNYLEVGISMLDIFQVFREHDFAKMDIFTMNHYLTHRLLTRYKGPDAYWKDTKYIKLLYDQYPPVFDMNALNDLLGLAYAYDWILNDEDGYFITEIGKDVLKSCIKYIQSSQHS